MEATAVPPPAGGVADPPGLDRHIGALFGRGGPGPRGSQGPDYGDDKALLKYFEAAKQDAYEDRWVYERGWWRNLLYTLGRQWIYYDAKRGQWQDKRLTKWMPRPVTNITAETVSAIRSVFQSVQLGIVARPVGNDPHDLTTAELADSLHPLLHREHDMDRAIREADFWVAVCANAFFHVWWDKNSESNGTIVVPQERCEACGATYAPTDLMGPMPTCKACGSPFFTKVNDGGTQMRVGKGATDALSPFEVAFPPGYSRFGDVPFVFRQRWRTKRYYEQFHPDLIPKLRFSRAPSDRSLQLLRALATQNDVSSSPLAGWSGGAGGGGENSSEGIAEYELWVKPCQAWPEGLVLRVAGDSQPSIVRTADESLPGPLPVQMSDGRRLFPWVHVPFEQFGGRVWAKGPIDLICQKQDQINQLDALVQLIVQRTANPIWLKPKGAEVTSFTGEPGLVVEWNPLAAGGGGEPKRIGGENVPPSLMQIRKELLSDVERSAGTYDIIKGSKPTGVEAFSALQLLVERSQSRFSLVLAERGDAYRQWYQCALELERQYGPDQRIDSVLGPNRRWTFRAFERAQLDGAVQIIVEDGSQQPKTNLGKRAAVEQANQLRMINPQDPDQQYQIFRDFGISHLLPGLDANVKSALQLQDAFEQWAATQDQPPAPGPMMGGPGMMPGGMPSGMPPPGMPPAGAPGPGMMPGPAPNPFPDSPLQLKPWHEPQIHLAELKKWANSDRVRALLEEKPWLEPAITFHLTALQQAMNPPPPPGAPPTPGGGGGALAQSNAESGAPGDVPGGAKLGAQGRGPE